MRVRSRVRATVPYALAWMLVGCGRANTDSSVNAPGGEKAATTKILEAGAAALQAMPPLTAINAYLDGFHFYNGRMQDQMEAHHYCGILSEDLIQCVIFDANVKDAKLMGVEYIVSEPVFARLPAAEKALWHSHVHEVKSGQLVAPGIPEMAEQALMTKLIHTYGKTWHTWHTDMGDALPLGVPQLMMAFTAEGQQDPQMVGERDRRFGIDSQEKRLNRAEIPTPPIDPDADAWQRGRALQIGPPTLIAGRESPATPSERAP